MRVLEIFGVAGRTWYPEFARFTFHGSECELECQGSVIYLESHTCEMRRQRCASRRADTVST